MTLKPADAGDGEADAPALSAVLVRAPAIARHGGAYIIAAAFFLCLAWAGFMDVTRSVRADYVIQSAAVRVGFAPEAGALAAAYVDVGTAVQAGEAVAEIDTPAGRRAVRAPIDGVVTRMPSGPLGRAVGLNEPMVAVAPPESPRRALLSLAPTDARVVRVGQTVTFETHPDWRGRVLSVEAGQAGRQVVVAIDGAPPLREVGAARIVIAERSLFAAIFGAPEDDAAL